MTSCLGFLAIMYCPLDLWIRVNLPFLKLLLSVCCHSSRENRTDRCHYTHCPAAGLALWARTAALSYRVECKEASSPLQRHRGGWRALAGIVRSSSWEHWAPGNPCTVPEPLCSNMQWGSDTPKQPSSQCTLVHQSLLQALQERNLTLTETCLQSVCDLQSFLFFF